MRFYVSKCHDSLNGIQYIPEKYAKFVCVNPYYPATMMIPGTQFMIDSGAFQDVGADKRLSFEDALTRQLNYEKTVTKEGRPAESIVSYDWLVDEQLGEQGQFKERVSGETAEKYVEESIAAARFLASKRAELRPRNLVLSCQGTTVEQYLYCLTEVLKVAEPGDTIGFGGFCIISKSKEYEDQFYKVITEAFPMIAEKGIKRVHIFGVGIFRVLIQAEIYATLNGLDCSYDTSSCEINSVFGRVFDPVNSTICSVFNKSHKMNGYTPPYLAEFNVRTILDFWTNFREIPRPSSFVPGMFDATKKGKK